MKIVSASGFGSRLRVDASAARVCWAAGQWRGPLGWRSCALRPYASWSTMVTPLTAARFAGVSTLALHRQGSKLEGTQKIVDRLWSSKKRVFPRLLRPHTELVATTCSDHLATKTNIVDVSRAHGRGSQCRWGCPRTPRMMDQQASGFSVTGFRFQVGDSGSLPPAATPPPKNDKGLSFL